MTSHLGLASFVEWALPAGGLFLLLMAGMWMLYALLFLDPVFWMPVPGESGSPAGLLAGLLSRDSVLMGLQLGAAWILWQLLRRPEPDVLRVSTRSSAT